MGETALAVTHDNGIKACDFILEDGSKCGSTKHFAKMKCEKHYRALRRAGAYHDLPIKPKTPKALILENVSTVRRARRALLKAAPTFVDSLITAAKVAAQKGDSAPAEWGILHTRTIQPVQTASTNANTGLTVNVGVKVQSAKETEDSET